MKRIAALALVALTLMLGGCGTYGARSVEEIKEQREFVDACEEAGGHAGYDVAGSQNCELKSGDES